ncbi:unnamed protein product [Dimorphilus gyrociliatus]|uniref:Uncharacterized protein n=1 Tax=Dimorphilus gyrociliatus TaxID=2664684 RepID=A0A7I8W1B3_9ANNE|nr:unnamed protein product [Dimorphilus gyrociliatus]
MTNYVETEDDLEKVWNLQSKILKVVKNSRILLCLASGAKNNLLQTLDNRERPITCLELSKKCDMDESYVREWLDMLISCEVIDIIENSRVEKYCLRKYEEKSLISLLISIPESPNFMEILDRINESLKIDGPRGFPLSLVGETDDYYYIKGFEEIYPWSDIKSPYEVVPGLVNRLRAGISVLDSSCGSGSFIFSAAKHFPESMFIGVDSSKEAIEKAKKRQKHLSNVVLLHCKVDKLPLNWTKKFHYIRAINLLRKVQHPKRWLRELYRVLKIDGTISVIERELGNKLDDNTQEKPFPVVPLIQEAEHDESDKDDYPFESLTIQEAQNLLQTIGFISMLSSFNNFYERTQGQDRDKINCDELKIKTFQLSNKKEDENDGEQEGGTIDNIYKHFICTKPLIWMF